MRNIERGLKYSFDDICIVPSILSDIQSRSECIVNIVDPKNPASVGVFQGGAMLHFESGALEVKPIFASPMGAVIDENNWKEFYNRRICPVIPRTVKFKKRLGLMRSTFVAFSITEAKRIFIEKFDETKHWLDNAVSNNAYICIDIANGHMKELLNTIKNIKSLYKDQVIIMSGNIAHPRVYLQYAKAGCDYVRCSVGTGYCCTTSTLTAVHYPPASLLDDIWKIIKYNIWFKIHKTRPLIIMDGGISSYADCIKAYACGADYVMVGRMFGQCKEACSHIYEKLTDGSIVEPSVLYQHYTAEALQASNLYREYYGMSTRHAQYLIAKAVEFPDADETIKERLKNAEGNVEELKIDNTLDNWISIFTSSLKSTMSYCNVLKVNDLKNSRKVVISTNAMMKYKKVAKNK